MLSYLYCYCYCYCYWNCYCYCYCLNKIKQWASSWESQERELWLVEPTTSNVFVIVIVIFIVTADHLHCYCYCVASSGKVLEKAESCGWSSRPPPAPQFNLAARTAHFSFTLFLKTVAPPTFRSLSHKKVALLSFRWFLTQAVILQDSSTRQAVTPSSIPTSSPQPIQGRQSKQTAVSSMLFWRLQPYLKDYLRAGLVSILNSQSLVLILASPFWTSYSVIILRTVCFSVFKTDTENGDRIWIPSHSLFLCSTLIVSTEEGGGAELKILLSWLRHSIFCYFHFLSWSFNFLCLCLTDPSTTSFFTSSFSSSSFCYERGMWRRRWRRGSEISSRLWHFTFLNCCMFTSTCPPLSCAMKGVCSLLSSVCTSTDLHPLQSPHLLLQKAKF